MKNLRKLIEKDPYLKGAGKVLLACSGGMDSMALAHLLKEAEISFGIAHMNYQLRGEASESDQQFVLNWSWKNKVAFHTKTAPITTSNKGNIQSIAREMRYSWLEKIVEQYHYELILTAHHANDQLEGAFLKIWRGIPWGERYLMPALRDKIYRPLLTVRKNEIESWVKSNKIEFVEDESNFSSEKYDRNFIRLNILNPIEKRNPDKPIKLLGNFYKEEKQRNLFHWMIESIGAKLLKKQKDGWSLDLSEFEAISPPDPALLLDGILKSFGINHQISDQILSAETGAYWELSSGTLWLDRRILSFRNKEKAELEQTLRIEIDKPGTYEMPNGQIWEIIEMNNNAVQSEQTLMLELSKEHFQFPWIIRNWKDGDYMQPLGMKGSSKKLKDIFTDKKIPRSEKKQILFLEINNEIIWIPGIKKSESIAKKQSQNDHWLIRVKNNE